jgi:hypothetical protein
MTMVRIDGTHFRLPLVGKLSHKPEVKQGIFGAFAVPWPRRPRFKRINGVKPCSGLSPDLLVHTQQAEIWSAMFTRHWMSPVQDVVRSSAAVEGEARPNTKLTLGYNISPEPSTPNRIS